MECLDAKKLLSAYLDGELPAAETREATEHLRTCQPCTRELVALRKVTGLLQSLPPVKAPEYLAKNIKAHLESQPQLGPQQAGAEFEPAPMTSEPAPAKKTTSSADKPGWFIRYRLAVGGLAAAAAVLLVIYTNLTYFSNQSPPPETRQVPSMTPEPSARLDRDTAGELVKQPSTAKDAPAPKEKADPFKAKTLRKRAAPSPDDKKTDPEISMTPTPAPAPQQVSPLTEQVEKTGEYLEEEKKIDGRSLSKTKELNQEQIFGGTQRESSPPVRTETSTLEPETDDPEIGNVLSQTIQITCSDLLLCEAQVNRVINDTLNVTNKDGLNDRPKGDRGNNEENALAQSAPESAPESPKERSPTPPQSILPNTPTVRLEQLETDKSSEITVTQKKIHQDEKKTVQLRFLVPLEQKEQIIAQLKKLGQVKIDERALAGQVGKDFLSKQEAELDSIKTPGTTSDLVELIIILEQE